MDKVQKPDLKRKRLGRRQRTASEVITDLLGSVKGLPADLSAAKKKHLKATDYARKRPR